MSYGCCEVGTAGCRARRARRVPSRQQTMDGFLLQGPSNKELSEINSAISTYIACSGGSFNSVTSPAWYQLLHVLRPALFTKAERETLKDGSILAKDPKNLRGRHWHATVGLDQYYTKMREELGEKIQLADSLQLAFDGWVTEDSKVVNASLIIDGKSEYYLRSVECDGSENAEMLMSCFEAELRELPSEKVVAVIGDNTTHVIDFLKEVHREYPEMLVIGCVAHRCNLLAKDLGSIFKTDIFDVLSSAAKAMKRKPSARASFDAVRQLKGGKNALRLFGDALGCGFFFVLTALQATLTHYATFERKMIPTRNHFEKK